MEYEFTLKYQLVEDEDIDALLERLAEAGCDDALVGIGQPGRLSLEFVRESAGANEAIEGALRDVRTAVPGARLIEATPDLVGLTDVAEIVGVSRQNMRKLMLAHIHSFPAPTHEGSRSRTHRNDQGNVLLRSSPPAHAHPVRAMRPPLVPHPAGSLLFLRVPR